MFLRVTYFIFSSTKKPIKILYRERKLINKAILVLIKLNEWKAAFFTSASQNPLI